MHETSIALALMGVASGGLREHGAARITALTVRVGQWSPAHGAVALELARGLCDSTAGLQHAEFAAARLSA